MQNNYIVRTKYKTLMSFYYTTDGGIYCKIYEDESWGKSKLIIANVREYYSVCMAENGTIYLFCQNMQGDIILCKNEENKWTQNIILKNRQGSAQNIIFNAMITDTGMSLVYNVPIKNEKLHYLTMQTLSDKGKWQEANRIDKIDSLPDSIFQFQPIRKNHSILFYQKRMPETNIGYREITPEKAGVFNSVHTTGYQLVDYSFLTTNNNIHFLYIIKSMFSSQIIYRRKEDYGFTNPVIIWEGQKLSNCNLCIINDDIYVSWIFNAQLYYCISHNKGDSFERPVKYKKRLSFSPKKAIYLSYDKMNENDFVCRELFVDNLNVPEILFLPDFCSNFYPVKDEVKPEMVQSISKDENIYDENLEKVKNQLFLSKSQLTQKDKQILQLTNLLQGKNEEIVNIDNNWKIKTKRLLAEKENIRISRDLLIKENENLKKKLNEYESKNKNLEPVYLIKDSHQDIKMIEDNKDYNNESDMIDDIDIET